MLQHVSDKLRQAELELQLRFPKKLFDFIRKLDKAEVTFGEEKWLFPIVTDRPEDPAENFIISQSEWFKEHWNMNALVFAVGEYGDYLLALQDKDGKVSKKLFVLIAESSEIKHFSNSLENLIEDGPFDYMRWDDYYLKLGNGIVILGDDEVSNSDE